MQPSAFFREFEEVGRDPRMAVTRPRVFPNTRVLTLDPVERPWARWDGGALGDSGAELWRVRSTGHAISLVGANRWSYHLPLRGRMNLTFGRDASEVHEGDGALLGTRRRRTHVVAGHGGLFDGVVILLDPPFDPLDAGGTTQHDIGIITARDRGALAAYLRFLSVELHNPDSAVHTPSAMQAAGALLQELFAETISAARGPASSDAASAGRSYVRQAEEVMRARLAEPLTIHAVAKEVGVGVRSLQAAFAVHRNASPRAVLTSMRLDAARNALISPGTMDTVTNIAFDCGFAHLGRFARAYAERFGEVPSDTLTRGRAVRPSSH
jgi:AraC-like DNA-binding protein